MATILQNGDVIPSQYEVSSTQDFDTGSYFGNMELRQGEITKIHYPDEKTNKSKKFIEYDVYVEMTGNGTCNGEKIYNVVMFNLLGSLSDRTVWTLRPAEKPVVNSNKNDLKAGGNGSKVLVMFINGEGVKPVIIGGLRDRTDETEKADKKSEAGHHYEHVFNGLATEIDKNGALTITFNGPTKNDGKLDDKTVKKEATGSTIKILKNGNVSLSDAEDRNQVLVDHEEDRILISSATGVIQMDSDGILITTPTGATIQLESSDTESSINLFDGAGSSLSLTKDGISAVDKSGSSVSLSGDGTVTAAGDAVVLSGGQIDLAGGSCTVGQGADSFMVRGTELKAILMTIINTAASSLLPWDGGAFQTAMVPIIAQINTILLSQSNKVK